MERFAHCRTTLMMLALAGLLLVLLFIVADLAAIGGKHKAGYPIHAESGRFLFRSARAHIDTNESISAFSLPGLVGMLVNANAGWLTGLSVAWITSLLAPMGLYYPSNKPL